VFGYGVDLLCGGARFANTLTEPELELIDLCPLFTRVRGRGVLGSPLAGSCIAPALVA
jgi:hypothetical protein